MTALAWNEAYQQLWSQAAQCRGMAFESLNSDDARRSWPRTHCSDVLSIASVVDPLVRGLSHAPDSQGIARRWRYCTEDLARFAIDEPAREYPHNHAFWPTLAATVAHLAHQRAPVPDRMWRALLSQLSRSEDGHYFDDDTYVHFSADTYDELWRQQKGILAQLRGADVREMVGGPGGRRSVVPRATNSDAMQLAMFWTLALIKADRKGRSLADPMPAAVGFDGVQRRWHALLAQVDVHVRTHHPTAPYPDNENLWRTMAALAVTLAAIDDLPLRFDLTLHDLGPARRNLRTVDLKGTFSQNWSLLNTQLAAARGSEPPLPDKKPDLVVPRTTNGDVQRLTNYWMAYWKKLDDAASRGEVASRPGDGIDLAAVRSQWASAAEHAAVAPPASRADPYAKNDEFWRATSAVAKALDFFKQPAPAVQLTFDAPVDLLTRLGTGIADVARSVSSTVSEAVGSVARVVSQDAGKDAAKGFFDSFRTPLLVGGGALGALALYLLFFRHSPARHEAA